MTTDPLRRVARSSEASPRPVNDLVDRVFEGLLSQPLSWAGAEDFDAPTAFPAVDVSEGEDALTFELDLPGLAKEDIHVTVDGAQLMISGERVRAVQSEGCKLHRRERAFGAFNRTFKLPGMVDGGRSRARFDHGVLTVTVPKATEEKPVQIAIK